MFDATTYNFGYSGWNIFVEIVTVTKKSTN